MPNLAPIGHVMWVNDPPTIPKSVIFLWLHMVIYSSIYVVHYGIWCGKVYLVRALAC